MRLGLLMHVSFCLVPIVQLPISPHDSLHSPGKNDIFSVVMALSAGRELLMDTRTVSIGIQDFEDLRVNQDFYVDKTHFIKEWWENRDAVTLITRPRRFGKTLLMSMVEKFFDLECDGKGWIFEGLCIFDEERYRAMQGTYPVISLSFASIKEDHFHGFYRQIQSVIGEAYRKKDYLLKSAVLNEAEKRKYLKIRDGKASSEDYAESIRLLSDYLCRFHGRKVIILLDEYDTPMQEAYLNGYWDEMASFIRGFLGAALKTNPHLERALLTGITRISKESIFSDLNHLVVVTTTSCMYEDSFGFTEEEVFSVLDERGLGAWKAAIKQWYDGFRFGERGGIYNPWSITNFLKFKKIDSYKRKDGCIVRFNRKTCELAFGYPGKHLKSYYIAK